MARNLTKAPSCTKTHTIFSHIYCREQISTISVFFLIEQDTIQVDENIANICETRYLMKINCGEATKANENTIYMTHEAL